LSESGDKNSINLVDSVAEICRDDSKSVRD